MASQDRELQSILILSQESDLLFQTNGNHSPERIFTSDFGKETSDTPTPRLGKPTDQEINRNRSLDHQNRGRNLRLNRLISHSFDLGIDVEKIKHAKLIFPLLPGPKPSVIAQILREKGSKMHKKNASEFNLWHHPRAPSVLVKFLLEEQKRKKSGLRQTEEVGKCMKVVRKSISLEKKMMVRKPRAPLPPLKIVSYNARNKAIKRSETTMY